MPTYKNDAESKHIGITGLDGKNLSLAPGEQGQTYKFYDDPDLTKISDTPLENRVVNRQTITLSGTPQDVNISLLTAWILIIQITDNVTVYRQSATNTPPELQSHTDMEPTIQIPANRTFDKLVMTGAGTCDVIEYKE